MAQKLNKARQFLIDEYLKALSEDRLPWFADWERGGGRRLNNLPCNAITKRKYNGVNLAILIYVSEMKGFRDHRWLTFKQAQERKWQIKQGEHGTHIEYWYKYDIKQKKQVSDVEAEEIIKKDPKRAKDIVLTSRTYVVFNLEQIEGFKAPQTDQEEKPRWSEGEPTAYALGVVKGLGVKYKEDSQPRCYYDPRNDLIHMPNKETFYNEYGFASSLLHECSHATMSAKRLNLFPDNKGMFANMEEYAKEELVAEIASSFLCLDKGIEMDKNHIQNHKAYIQVWIKGLQDSPQLLFDSIKKAYDVCKYINKHASQTVAQPVQDDLEIEVEETWRPLRVGYKRLKPNEFYLTINGISQYVSKGKNGTRVIYQFSNNVDMPLYYTTDDLKNCAVMEMLETGKVYKLEGYGEISYLGCTDKNQHHFIDQKEQEIVIPFTDLARKKIKGR